MKDSCTPLAGTINIHMDGEITFVRSSDLRGLNQSVFQLGFLFPFSVARSDGNATENNTDNMASLVQELMKTPSCN